MSCSCRVCILPLQNKVQQFHHISVERVTASAAQHMLGMTLCVAHRMVGSEEVKLIDYGAHLVELGVELCHNTGVASSSHHTMTSRTLRYSLTGLLDFHVNSNSTEPTRAISYKLLTMATLHTMSYVY